VFVNFLEFLRLLSLCSVSVSLRSLLLHNKSVVQIKRNCYKMCQKHEIWGPSISQSFLSFTWQMLYLSTSKKVCLVKKEFICQINLSNPDLTYIRNLRETKLSLSPSTFWKLTSETLLCCLFFSTLHLFRNDDAKRTPRAYIYVLEAVFFYKLSKIAKSFI
jgi:hypothetical protein